MSNKKSTAASLLLRQYRELTDPKKAIPSFHIELADDSNIFLWDIGVMVLNEDSIYHGGYFKAQMKFPEDYPFSPPQFRFTPAIYHPNVYRDGRLCISILHQSGNSTSDEPDNETWSPVQTVESVLISIVSLLEDPNVNSPANVDAAVEFRKNVEQYQERVKLEVERSKQDIPSGFVMPSSSLHAYTSAANVRDISSRGSLTGSSVSTTTNTTTQTTNTNTSVNTQTGTSAPASTASLAGSVASNNNNNIRGSVSVEANQSQDTLSIASTTNTTSNADHKNDTNNNNNNNKNNGNSVSSSLGVSNKSNNNSADNFWYDSDLEDEDDVEMVFYESTDDEGDEIDAAGAEAVAGKANH